MQGRHDNFEVFPNKGLNRSLRQLQVYCTHRKDGCQWRGELGELNQHLTVRKECLLTVFPVELVMTNFEEMKRSNGQWLAHHSTPTHRDTRWVSKYMLMTMVMVRAHMFQLSPT